MRRATDKSSTTYDRVMTTKFSAETREDLIRQIESHVRTENSPNGYYSYSPEFEIELGETSEKYSGRYGIIMTPINQKAKVNTNKANSVEI